jgi:hemerythrin-like domain-containing protein
MQLLDDLRSEHDLIDQVLGSFRTWAGRLAAGEAPLSDRASFLDFFEVYAGAFHHEREEDVLFPLLTAEAALPSHSGPIAVLLDDHRRMATLLASIRSSADPAEILEQTVAYSHALWLHIDVENSVFLPESAIQLRRHGIYELPSRPPSAAEDAAAAHGRTLLTRYPPMEPDIIRGDGCVMCHAYGDTCRGLEREWWNDWEWEEMSEHVAAS